MRSRLKWMGRVSGVVLGLSLAMAACSSSTPSDGGGDVIEDTSLGALGEAVGITVGAGVEGGPLASEAAYRDVLRREFRLLTPGNETKMDALQPVRGQFRFTNADALIDFAEANDMAVRGHVLVWHEQMPSWVSRGQWTRSELMGVLEEHITTVVGRYKGRLAYWDVVNEAIDNNRLRDTVWEDVIGPEYIALAFQWAHAADPDAKLFYNEYGAEGLGAKSDAVYDLVKGLVEQGVPIHGVGFQMHISTEYAPSVADVRLNMRRLEDLGLEVHITELDVRLPVPAQPADLTRQAAIYNDVLKTCIDETACTALIFWGFTDKHSWIPSFAPGYGAALPFDENYQPKLAYQVMQQTLLDAVGN